MKRIILFFIAFAVGHVTAQSQKQERENEMERQELNALPEEDGEEDKTALEKMIQDRCFPFTDKNLSVRFADEMKSYRNSSPQVLTANWANINSSGNLNGDVGRATFIALDTINNGRFYVCTTNSGVWLTNNNGISYTPITESLPTQSTSCMVIDPVNTNLLYLATGTHNGDMLKNSIGVYKSVDGGITWNATGLSFSAANAITIGELIINPLNHNSLLAATTDGLYRTYDSGQTWTRILNDVTTSVRFKVSDTTFIHTVGSIYYRSIDAGVSFNAVTSGYFNSFTYHYENYIRTTAADPGLLYLIMSGLDVNPVFNPRFYIYQSTDDGLSFSLLDSLAGEVASQVNVSQLHPDKFIGGYRHTFKKENASTAFQSMTVWYPATASNFMHADQRGMFFDPYNDSIIYSCNDGGLYRSIDNGATFQNITGNMQLSHLYTFSNADSTNYKLLASPLDVYPYIIGSSGISQSFSTFVESFSSHLNKLNDNKFYLAHQTPGFTIDNGASFYNSTSPLIGNSAYHIHNFSYDNCDENISYYGSYNDIFKSTDNSHTFGYYVHTNCNPVNSFTREQQGFEVSRANTKYIYVYYTDSVYVTTTGTSAFTNITAGLPAGQAVISHLAVDPADEKKVWVSFSGYSAGNKVFYSADAGQNWVNVSAGLPNIPVNALVCQKGVPGAVYAGTDGGVFYRDNTFSSWQYYSTNLPAVMVTALDMQYSIGKIRCSTFGRGIWESDFYQPTPVGYVLPPVAMFTASTVNTCPGELISFTNTSCGIVDSIRWLFPGAIPSTSSSNIAAVSYSASGQYSVTLIAYNSGGADTLTEINYINVTTSSPIPYYEPVSFISGSNALPNGCYATEVNFDNNTWLRWWWVDNISGNIDGAIIYDNFDYNLNGLSESLIFPAFDFAGVTHPTLYFDRSYVMRSAMATDTLKIFAKSCGNNKVLLYNKGGAQLANLFGFYSSNYWQPTFQGDWSKDSVDLTVFAGQPHVTIEFDNVGYNGQILYLNEIKVENNLSSGISNNSIAPAVSIFPNPFTSQTRLVFSKEQNHALIKLKDILQKEIKTFSLDHTSSLIIDKGNLNKGVYFVEITDENKNTINKKIVVQ